MYEPKAKIKSTRPLKNFHGVTTRIINSLVPRPSDWHGGRGKAWDKPKWIQSHMHVCMHIHCTCITCKSLYPMQLPQVYIILLISIELSESGNILYPDEVKRSPCLLISCWLALFRAEVKGIHFQSTVTAFFKFLWCFKRVSRCAKLTSSTACHR